MKAISSCLCGICCTYKGSHHEVSGCRELVERGEAIMICPEVLGGLSIPRTPAERVHDQVLTMDGNDVTEAFVEGARKVVELCRLNHVDEVILKSKSPSCGIGAIYDGTFSHTLVEGNGITAQRLMDEGFTVLSDIEFEKRKRKLENE